MIPAAQNQPTDHQINMSNSARKIIRNQTHIASAAFAAVILLAAGALPTGADNDGTAAAVAEKAAAELMTVMGAELQEAMQTGGPVAAIDICGTRAQALGAEIPQRMGRPDITIRRTSLQVRNPANMPSPEEKKVLRQFAEKLRDGSALQPVSRHTKTGLTYYRPILTKPLCLACHGDPARMDPAVRETLRRRYPGDSAVGFSAGELRGMISVTVPPGKR